MRFEHVALLRKVNLRVFTRLPPWGRLFYVHAKTVADVDEEEAGGNCAQVVSVENDLVRFRVRVEHWHENAEPDVVGSDPGRVRIETLFRSRGYLPRYVDEMFEEDLDGACGRKEGHHRMYRKGDFWVDEIHSGRVEGMGLQIAVEEEKLEDSRFFREDEDVSKLSGAAQWRNVLLRPAYVHEDGTPVWAEEPEPDELSAAIGAIEELRGVEVLDRLLRDRGAG